MSILNQPSRSSELEPFRQSSVLSRKASFSGAAGSGAEIVASDLSRTNGFDAETRGTIGSGENAERRSEGHEDRSINGHLNAVPLHRLMSKDEIQLFLSPQNEEIESSRNDPSSPPINSNAPLIRSAATGGPPNSSDAKNRRSIEQLANQSARDDYLSNKYANEQISDNQPDASLGAGNEGKVFSLFSLSSFI